MTFSAYARNKDFILPVRLCNINMIIADLLQKHWAWFKQYLYNTQWQYTRKYKTMETGADRKRRRLFKSSPERH